MSRSRIPTRSPTYAGHGNERIGFLQTDIGACGAHDGDFTSPRRLTVTERDPTLLTGFSKTGKRGNDDDMEKTVYGIQTYIIRNVDCRRDRGENVIYGKKAISINWTFPSVLSVQSLDSRDLTSDPATAPLAHGIVPMYRSKLVKDGHISGYILSDMQNNSLIKIHTHGNTKSLFDRTIRSLFRPSMTKWDVENYGLYSTMEIGQRLGMIRDIYPDHRIFEPSSGIEIPRLEMRSINAFGSTYFLIITGCNQPIGRVESSIIQRVSLRNEQYTLFIQNCTKEEALIWFTLVLATDMKRRRNKQIRIIRPSIAPIFF